MIIHLRNKDDAEKLPHKLFALSYLTTYECADDTVAVVKWRNAPERLYKTLKCGSLSLISREDYKELNDFIIDTYYKRNNNGQSTLNKTN